LQSTAFQRYSLIVYGIFLIGGGILFSGGVTGIGMRLFKRCKIMRQPTSAVPTKQVSWDSGTEIFPGQVLQVSKVKKQFGGLIALNTITLAAEQGKITAIIGANGSGKTTLLNLISGFYRPDSGSLMLGKEELKYLAPHKVARCGVGRTFQTPLIPLGLTAAQVVATARYSNTKVSLLSSVLRLPRHKQIEAADRTEALKLLALVGIRHVADMEAASLPLGTRRLLEVARAIAARPALLLLDEPAAGLDKHELKELADAISRIRASGGTAIVVEHNIQFVLSLADTIYVLDRGSVVSYGRPDEISSDPAVIESYLGKVTNSI
jgi:branched-chain amino acid transport system permease protein